MTLAWLPLPAASRDGGGRLLASVAFGWFLILGLRFAIPSILPTIADGFGASDAQAGLAMTALWATYAAMQLPGGYYSQRLGERRLLVAALLTSAVVLVAYSATPTFSLFVLATAVFGLGNGVYGPARDLIVSKRFTERDNSAFAVVLAGGSLGAAALPIVAAVAVVAVGWRTTLGAFAPLLVLGALGIWWSVPSARPSGAAEQPSVRSLLRGSVVAVTRRRVALGVAGVTVMLFAFQGVTAFLTTYLIDLKGLSQSTAGTMLGGLFVVAAGSHLVCGRLADRYGAPRVLVGISLVSVLPLVLLPSLEGRLALGLASAVIGIRLSVSPVAHAYIIAVLPDAVRETAWGALRTEFFLVSSLGSTLVGVMADAGRFDLAFYVLAGLTGLGGLCFAFLPER